LSIKIKVEFWKIDSWDGEKLYILVDKIEVWSKHFDFYDPGIFFL